MAAKSNRIAPSGEATEATAVAGEEPTRLYTESLSGQDVFDIEALAYARGVKPSALLSAWLADRLETVRRCRDIEKAEERAALRNPDFVSWAQLPERDRQRYRALRGGGDLIPWDALPEADKKRWQDG